MSYYLLEIGTEEIPASFINPSADFLKQEISKQLADKNLNFNNILSNGTPRRLYLYIEGLPERQPDSEVEMTGPPANIAFDEDGNLTKAGLGFVKSKGLDMDSLKKISTPKGEYLSGIKKTVGLDTKIILKELIENLIKSIPFKKSMKWGNGDFRFARPIHWLLSLFDDEVLEISIENLTSSNITFGHRFMSKGSITIKNFEEYKEKLSQAKVIVDFEDRKKIVAEKLADFSNKNKFKVQIDEDLLDTVANLVEYPHPILGEFSKDFLVLPKEALITSMKYHQKYFYVTDENDNILNYFVGISNTVPEDDNVVKNGYERVLRARLSDAMFFYENDKKVPLDDRVEELKKVVYQVKLGTSYEKIQRFSAVAKWLTSKVKPEIEKTVLRAAYLCKADLMTEMVYEFAELQGIMGRQYALIAGEDKNVADAILEHYLPKFAGDELPKTDEGAIVSISDKIDTICGCFSINLIPTGNNDPYALRRAAIGILQIIKHKNYRINLKELINVSLEQLKSKVEFDNDEVAAKVYQFIMLRYKQLLLQENISQDAFEAVYERFNDIITIQKAAQALTVAKKSEEFEIISGSYKRISNILKKQNWDKVSYNKNLFTSKEEEILASVLESQTEVMKENLKNENFENLLSALMEFAKPVDAFFENVMVMVEDEKIRNNRLSLLASLKQSFDILGELSKVG
jgi:glycyl-tRNA synthetase beta chain